MTTTGGELSQVSVALLKGLSESKYERRKGAALELERTIRDWAVSNNSGQIAGIIQVLVDTVNNNPQPTIKSGALMGLAAVAIALGQAHIADHLESLLLPVLNCLDHQNNQVRYAACEAAFNICKVSRAHLLNYFEKLFHGCAKLAMDQDQAVRSGGEVFNNLLKAVIMDATPATFDFKYCVSLLRHYSGSTSAFGRHFIIGWIMTLDSKQDFSILRQLPDCLLALFDYLSDRQQTVVVAAENCLADMLKRLNESTDGLDVFQIANIVIANCGNEEKRIQATAMAWLAALVEISGAAVLRVLSGALRVVLQALSFDPTVYPIRSAENRTIAAIVEKALAINSSLSVMIRPEMDGPLKQEEMQIASPDSSSSPVTLSEVQLDISAIVTVLTELLKNPSTAVPTKIESIRWIQNLLTRLPKMTAPYIPDLFTILLMSSLADADEPVVMIGLQVLVDISTNHTPSLFSDLIANILSLQKRGTIASEERFVAIVRQLALLVSPPDRAFAVFADHLGQQTNDIYFPVRTIRLLNRVLLYAPELHHVRQKLCGVDDAERLGLFSRLFVAWSHCTASALGLALLARRYELANSIVAKSSNFVVTVDLLAELDRLVQFLESPLFTSLRLHLLSQEHRQPLEQCLFGLLMLLPQSSAFEALRRRLSVLPPSQGGGKTTTGSVSTGNDGELLTAFLAVQIRQEKATKREQLGLLQFAPTVPNSENNGTVNSN